MTAGAEDGDGDGGPLRVFLVDDHAIVRAGVRGYLDLVDDITVAGEARGGQQAIDAIAVLEPSGKLPDVVLMDLVMPGMDGIEATRRIRARWPGIEVVAVTSFAEEPKVRSALEAGAAGYLLKDADADQVAAAIRAAAAGQCHLDPAVARILADSLNAPRPAAGTLTARERDVLAQIASGATNRQIASRLGISERTARTCPPSWPSSDWPPAPRPHCGPSSTAWVRYPGLRHPAGQLPPAPAR